MAFIKKMKFWISLGALVVVSGVALGVFFIPARVKSAEAMASWVKRAGEAGTYAQTNELPVPDSIKQAQELKARYEQDVDDIMRMLSERDKLFEGRYIPDPKTGDEEAREPGEWKIVYREAMLALEKEITKSFRSAPSSLLTIRDYGDTWPAPQEMRTQAKGYWLRRHLLETLAGVNDAYMVVPALRRFAFETKAERFLHPMDGTTFRPVGFEFDLDMDFLSLPGVVANLLECPITLNITSVSVMRETGGARSAAPGGPIRMGPPAGIRMGPPAGIRMGPPAGIRMGPPAGIRMGPPAGIPTGPSRTVAPARVPAKPVTPVVRKTPLRRMVSVTIKGYLLDYTPTPKKQAETKEEG